MKELNYTRLMAHNPTVYDTLTNREGQEMQLVEHPLKGDEYPVIIVYHAEKVAYCSDFWDTDDLMGGEDYEPVFKEVANCMFLRFEIEDINDKTKLKYSDRDVKLVLEKILGDANPLVDEIKNELNK